jgi:hypothetical protein
VFFWTLELFSGCSAWCVASWRRYTWFNNWLCDAIRNLACCQHNVFDWALHFYRETFLPLNIRGHIGTYACLLSQEFVIRGRQSCTRVGRRAIHHMNHSIYLYVLKLHDGGGKTAFFEKTTVVALLAVEF